MSDLDDLLAFVERETGFERWYLIGRNRTADLAAARAATMVLMREDLRLPIAEIGRIFGRDRATIRFALDSVASPGRSRRVYLSLRRARPRPACSTPIPPGATSCAA